MGSLITVIFNHDNFASWLFLLAICFSFLGDLFMARIISLSNQRIIDGAIGFGFAHLVYIIAFNKLSPITYNWWLILLGIGISLVLYYIVVYNSELSGQILIASFLYSSLLATFLITIASFILTSEVNLFVQITSFTGVLLFVISDSIIAINEFKQEIKHASEIIAVTYILSQVSLQLSAYFSLT
ncbi:MAG: lysoplasmalogenase family protein [Candidatus Kariarchaeaceae archaeon]